MVCDPARRDDRIDDLLGAALRQSRKDSRFDLVRRERALILRTSVLVFGRVLGRTRVFRSYRLVGTWRAARGIVGWWGSAARRFLGVAVQEGSGFRGQAVVDQPSPVPRSRLLRPQAQVLPQRPEFR